MISHLVTSVSRYPVTKCDVICGLLNIRHMVMEGRNTMFTEYEYHLVYKQDAEGLKESRVPRVNPQPCS